MKLLFLANKMKFGYGVSVVIVELMKHLSRRNIECHTGCREYDKNFYNTNVHKVNANYKAVKTIARQFQIDTVIAHTSPFFELLPSLANEFQCWAYEHGDPSPSFFATDSVERQKNIDNKIKHCYPCVKGVIAISHFIRHDIHWPRAKVIYNGCDHIVSCFPKSCDRPGNELRVGTLMRLGTDESFYKGNSLFIRLMRMCKSAGMNNINFYVMGRGKKIDAEEFTNYGAHVLLNATDQERLTYLRSLDIFISPSLWEGFDLPLIEAQISGACSIAFDIGAHPEVTPLLATNVRHMFEMIKAYSMNPQHLLETRKMCYNYVRSRFSWSKTCDKLLGILQEYRC